MKNMSKRVLILFISLVVFSSIFSTATFAKRVVYPIPATDVKKQVNISTDPRIELISIMQMLIGAWPMTELDFDYVREIQEKFYPYYGHSAVRMFSFLWYNYEFSQEIPSTFMLHLSDPPELKIQVPFSKEIISRAGGERNLNDFLELLRLFAKDTDFYNFYQDHRIFYQEIMERVEKKLGTKNTIPMLEKYFGFTNRSYSLILVPLFSDEGYGTHVDTNYFALLGPYDVDEKKESRKPYWSGPDELHRQLLKSFSYAFVNPLLYKNKKDVDVTAKLFSPISMQMRYQRILDWQNCFIEHIVRGVSLSFTMSEYGEEEWSNQRLRDIQDYFVYIDYVNNWLNVYEQNRKIYKDFEGFYSVLFNNIRQLSECPIIPTQIGIDYQSENGVQISWYDNSVEAISFQVLRKSENKPYEVIYDHEKSNISAWTDRNVEIGKSYWYKIAITGEGGTIQSYGVKSIIPVYPPLAPEKVIASLVENQLTFAFTYPYKAHGFTLFEWKQDAAVEISSISIVEEKIQTITLDTPPAGEHLYYICSFIVTKNNKEEEIKIHSSPSNFVSLLVP